MSKKIEMKILNKILQSQEVNGFLGLSVKQHVIRVRELYMLFV